MSLVVMLAPTVGAVFVIATLITLLQLVDGEGITIYDRSISQSLTRVNSYRVVAVPLSIGAFLFFLSIIIRNIQIDIQLRSDHFSINSLSRNGNEASQNDTVNTCRNIDTTTQTEPTHDKEGHSNSNRSRRTYSSSESSSSLPSSRTINLSSLTTNYSSCFRSILRAVNYLSAILNVVSLIGFVMLVVFKAMPGQDKEGREAYLHNLGSYIYFGGSVLYGWLHVLILFGMKICSSHRSRIDSSCSIYDDIERMDDRNNEYLNHSIVNLETHQRENDGSDDAQLCDVKLGRDDTNIVDEVNNFATKRLRKQQLGWSSNRRNKRICYSVCHAVCLLLMSASGIATTYSTVKYMQLFKDGYQWEWFAVIFASAYMCLFSALFILENPMYELRIATNHVRGNLKNVQGSTPQDPHVATETMTVSRKSSPCLSPPISVRKETADTLIMDDNGDKTNFGALEEVRP